MKTIISLSPRRSRKTREPRDTRSEKNKNMMHNFCFNFITNIYTAYITQCQQARLQILLQGEQIGGSVQDLLFINYPLSSHSHSFQYLFFWIPNKFNVSPCVWMLGLLPNGVSNGNALLNPVYRKSLINPPTEMKEATYPIPACVVTASIATLVILPT